MTRGILKWRFSGSLALAVLLVIAIFVCWSWQRSRGVSTLQAYTVGLLVDGSRYSDGWYSLNFDAAVRASAKAGAELIVTDNLHGDIRAMMNACDQMLRRGTGIIMLSSFQDPSLLRSYMKDHAYVQFTGYDDGVTLKNYHSLRFKLYEAAYMLGAAAALKSKSGIAGFIVPDLNHNAKICVNAFMMGAKAVRDKFKVLVSSTGAFSDQKKAEDSVDTLTGRGADVICYRLDEDHVSAYCEKKGINYVSFNTLSGVSSHALLWSEFDFSTYFSEILRAYSERTLRDLVWIGAQDGAFGPGRISSRLGRKARERINEIYDSLSSGDEVIFKSPLVDNYGHSHSAQSDYFSDRELLGGMNFWVQGVEITDAR